MATLALPRALEAHTQLNPALNLDGVATSGAQGPTPVPNKHIPNCPAGPVPQQEPNSPPLSPSKADSPQRSLLFPPEHFVRLDSGPLSVYKIDAQVLASALDYLSSQPLPDPTQVFPWFHGLHPSNHVQLSFFLARRRAFRRTPGCLRGITIVKASGDLGTSRLKGAISPEEFMRFAPLPEFADVDPKAGFSVRNFQIQAAKSAMTSDIVVYGDDDVRARKLAWDIATAQQRVRDKHEALGHHLPTYNTFLCTSPFAAFETSFPQLVAVDSSGHLNSDLIDFYQQERREMYDLTEASQISENVWLGPTPDPTLGKEQHFDLLIECVDGGQLNATAIRAVYEAADDGRPKVLEFPSSGSLLAPTWSQEEGDDLIEACKLIYGLAHGTGVTCVPDKDVGDEAEVHPTTRPRKILIHCADGYTESTLLGIAYFSFSTGRTIPDAWVDLHVKLGRNFFAYPTDVAFLRAISPRLLSESPLNSGQVPVDVESLHQSEPKWLSGLDGSLPSRILDYMYLGNLGHANNPHLLQAIGIGQILSVGESVMWREGELEEWGPENLCVVESVQDNGIDSLTDEFERCLEFIERGRRNGTATLVHCRVGVSRSATICIAEVMREKDMSFSRAYCFVRARRLNVIIQPHLRFAYELLKWDEKLQQARAVAEGGEASFKRELEWGEIAREIALLNKPYAR